MTYSNDKQGSFTTDVHLELLDEFAPAFRILYVVLSQGHSTRWIGATETLGYSADELECESDLWNSIIHPADRPKTLEAYERLDSGERFNQQYRIYDKDGQLRWVFERGEATPTGRIRLIYDITQLKTTLPYQPDFKSLIEESPLAVLMFDGEHRVRYTNDSAARLFGLSGASDLLGRDIASVLSQQSAEALCQDLGPRLQKGPWSGDMTIVRRDGVTLELRASIVRDTLDTDRFAAIFTDITEVKRTEEALRESEQRFRSLIEDVDGIIFRIDPSYNLIAIWGRTMNNFGYTLADLTQNPELWWTALPEEDLNRAKAGYIDAATTKKPIVLELRIINIRSGTIGWVRTHITPKFDTAGELLYFDGVALDITERVEAQQLEERHSTVMGILSDINTQLASSLDAQQILDYAAARLCDELSCICVGITAEPFSGQLRLLSVCSKDAANDNKIRNIFVQSHFKIEDLFGSVETTARIIPDLRTMSPVAEKLSAEIVDSEIYPQPPVMVAPLSAGFDTVGIVLCVRKDWLSFNDNDLWLLSEVAYHTSAALGNAALYSRQTRIAETLQRSLMPTKVNIAGLDIATLYSPAPGEFAVGGDFFSIFELNHSAVALVVGDVSGKGVQAAVHTAEAKYMLRALAHQNPDPSYVIKYLNETLCDFLPDEIFITLIYCLVDVHDGHIRYCNAGHEAPLMLCVDQSDITELHPTGPILGVTKNALFETAQFNFHKNDILFCYTDGVTDVRIGGNRFGYELYEVVASAPQDSAQSVMDHVMDRIRSFGPGAQTDDQVVVVIRSPS